VPERAYSIAAAGGAVSVGNYTGYLSAVDLEQSDIQPSSTIAWEGKTYQIEYRRSIMGNGGEVLMHQVRLVQTQTQSNVSPAR
jgi:hypothetical protein